MDNRVVIWEHRGYKGINGIGNNIVKFKKKITINNKNKKRNNETLN